MINKWFTYKTSANICITLALGIPLFVLDLQEADENLVVTPNDTLRRSGMQWDCLGLKFKLT